jgi:DNA-binding transcriptional MerR regulator
MPDEPDSFDLNELSAAASVTPRTVRYYVQQGLLPSPGTRGPGTRYERAHLDRLQLIRRLQRQHLPLAEIRLRLDALDDDGVREALATVADLPEPSPRSSALAYVRELLSRHAPYASVQQTPAPIAQHTAARPEAPSAKVARTLSGIFKAHLADAGTLSAPLQQSRTTRSTWDRIPLAPDVELHIRRPLSREQNRQVERLIEAARDLFAEEP